MASSGADRARGRLAQGLYLGKKRTAMNNLLNIIIVLLIVGWLIGYIGFSTAVGSLIHILLVIAVIAIVYRLVTGRRADL